MTELLDPPNLQTDFLLPEVFDSSTDIVLHTQVSLVEVLSPVTVSNDSQIADLGFLMQLDFQFANLTTDFFFSGTGLVPSLGLLFHSVLSLNLGVSQLLKLQNLNLNLVSFNNVVSLSVSDFLFFFLDRHDFADNLFPVFIVLNRFPPDHFLDQDFNCAHLQS